MTITNVYIGELSEGADPLVYIGAGGVETVPARLGEFFPPAPRDPFYLLLGKIRDGRMQGQQVDWGASAANVSKQEIIDFITEVYRDDPTYVDPTKWPHLFPKLGELERFVAALPDRRYALVAIEL